MCAGYPSGPMTVSRARAAQIARQWLAHNRPGATIEAPDQFPGYYTIHFHKIGKIAGMLSVNGYSGQVWYHTWHGDFTRVKAEDLSIGRGHYRKRPPLIPRPCLVAIGMGLVKRSFHDCSTCARTAAGS